MDFITHARQQLALLGEAATLCLHAFCGEAAHLRVSGYCNITCLTLRCSSMVCFSYFSCVNLNQTKNKLLTRVLDIRTTRVVRVHLEEGRQQIDAWFKVFVCHHSWHHLSDVDLFNVTTMQH